MVVIAVSNPNKGGVGKTTTAICTGAALAQMGFNVLLLDLDKQTHETKWLGVRSKGARTIYHLFDECITQLHEGEKLNAELSSRLQLEDTVVQCEKFYLIPGSTRAGDVEAALSGVEGGGRILSFILKQMDANFDFCIIDCPPQAERLNEAAMGAADYVLVPLRIGLLDLDGVAMTMRQVDKVTSTLNPNLKVLGILPTFFVERSQLKSAVMEEARRSQLIAPHLMKSAVPQSTVYGQLPGMQASPFAAGRSEAVRRAANTYVEVAGEMLIRMGMYTKAQVKELTAQAIIKPISTEEVARAS